MEIDRIKEKRKGLRIAFTKHLNKVETAIALKVSEQYSQEMKTNDLLSLKSQLNEKINDLIKADDEVQLQIDFNDMAAEIAVSEDYKDKGIEAKSKIERNLEMFYSPTNTTNLTVNTTNARNPFIINENRNSVKLPKLTIKTFYGDCIQYLDFWNSFEVAIHNNDSLSKIEKFTYLKSYLGGIALSAVSGFALTNENYDASIQLLKERFGRTDVIMSSHMHKLLLIEPVKSCNNIIGLRKMYDAIEIQIRSLQSLGVAAGTYSNLLCPVILQKLPEELNLNFNRQSKTKELFDISLLLQFIREEVNCREASLILANPKNPYVKDYSLKNKTDLSYPKRPHYSNPSNQNNKSSAEVLAAHVDDKHSHPHKFVPNAYSGNFRRNLNPSNRFISDRKCIFCSRNHMDHDCSLSVYEKKRSLMSKGLCFICFQNHIRKFCDRNYQRCKHCHSFSHNSLICSGNERNERKDISSPAIEAEQGAKGDLPKSETQNASASSMASLSSDVNKTKKRNSSSILLQTFSASCQTDKGVYIQLRCMLDGGANKSFILREIAETLNLKVINKEALNIYTFGNKTAENRLYDVVEVTLNSIRNADLKIKIHAIVIDSITSAQINIPSQWVRNIAQEKGIELADIGPSDRIHVLIGSDYISKILGERNIRLSTRLIAVDSIFGALIQRRDKESDCGEVKVNHLFVENQELDFDRVKYLWQLETIGINADKEASLSDKEILEMFKHNTTYMNKRYETQLLWKEDNKILNSNFEIAKRRLFSLIKTLENNEKLYSKYDEIINEHIRDGIVERVNTEINQNTNEGYFLPHHAVVKEKKDSTKVRIVFDGSSKGKGEVSLNDCLHSGPNLNPDLLKLILRFRINKIAICADIQRAYLEIGIAKHDREFLKFLWIKERSPNLNLSNHNVQTLQYKRVTFGIKCSSFLLSATIRMHLEKYCREYEEACEMLKDLYTDDLINGTSGVQDALRLSKEMIFILGEASMNLRKWATNSSILEEAWKRESIDCRQTSQELGVPLKILGLIWDNIYDNLKFDIQQFEIQNKKS